MMSPGDCLLLGRQPAVVTVGLHARGPQAAQPKKRLHPTEVGTGAARPRVNRER